MSFQYSEVNKFGWFRLTSLKKNKKTSSIQINIFVGDEVGMFLSILKIYLLDIS
jgi:hypothetical protein